MSCGHKHHEHGHGGQDHHGDHHHHGSDSHGSGKVSEGDKLFKMLEHWVHHNEEHARSFREWAERARSLGQEEVAAILEETAAAAHHQNKRLEDALAILKQA